MRPLFVHRSQTNTRRTAGSDQPEQPSQEKSPTDSPVKVAASTVKPRRQGLSVFQAWTVAGILLTTASVATWFGLRERKKERLAHASISANWQTPLPQASIHALMGNDRAPYVDHSGNTCSHRQTIAQMESMSTYLRSGSKAQKMLRSILAAFVVLLIVSFR